MTDLRCRACQRSMTNRRTLCDSCRADLKRVKAAPQADLVRFAHRLDYREQRMLALRLAGQDQRAIGRTFNVRPERVKQVQAEADLVLMWASRHQQLLT